MRTTASNAVHQRSSKIAFADVGKQMCLAVYAYFGMYAEYTTFLLQRYNAATLTEWRSKVGRGIVLSTRQLRTMGAVRGGRDSDPLARAYPSAEAEGKRDYRGGRTQTCTAVAGYVVSEGYSSSGTNRSCCRSNWTYTQTPPASCGPRGGGRCGVGLRCRMMYER